MAARRYEISPRVLTSIFQHEKSDFVSPSDHVIFFLLYIILTIQQKMAMLFSTEKPRSCLLVSSELIQKYKNHFKLNDVDEREK